MNWATTLWILGLNTLVACVFLILAVLRRRPWPAALARFLLAFLCPVIGPLLLLLPALLARMTRAGLLRREEVGFEKGRRRGNVIPDERTELQVAPLADTLLVAQNAQKRAAMLYLLRQDLDRYLRIIAYGVYNEDTETSHYAAATILKANADFQKAVNRLSALYARDSADAEVNRTYADTVWSYLEARLPLADADARKYRYLYVSLLANLYSRNPAELHIPDMRRAVATLLVLREDEQAAHWVERLQERAPDTEEAYLTALHYYYSTGQPRAFEDTMERLRQSKLLLSREGLGLMRFFSGNAWQQQTAGSGM